MIMEEEIDIEQSSPKRLPVLYGENVILVPFLDVIDMDDFIRLHMADKNCKMCRFCMKFLNLKQAEDYAGNLISNGLICVWNVILKSDKEKRLGFIYLSDMMGHSAHINGIMDKQAIKKLPKNSRSKVKSFADDAAMTLIDSCFSNGFTRIAGDATEDNKEAIAMHIRLGFYVEGILRKAVKVDDKYKNVVLVSILKEEWNGKDRISTNL